jgi:hypothetical protein
MAAKPNRACAEAKMASATVNRKAISCWKQNAPMPMPTKLVKVASPVIWPLCLGSNDVVILDISGCVASNPADKAVMTSAATKRGLEGINRNEHIAAQIKPAGTT